MWCGAREALGRQVEAELSAWSLSASLGAAHDASGKFR